MDIDGDGVKDILSTCYSQRGYKVMVGSFWVLLDLDQVGFAKPAELKGSDGKTLMVHPGKERFVDWERSENTCTRPFAADWDGDGDLDLLATSTSAKVVWAENIREPGQNGPPLLRSFEVLLASKGGGKNAGPRGSTRMHIEDVNGDGKLDILMGDNARTTRAQSRRSPLRQQRSGLSKSEMRNSGRRCCGEWAPTGASRTAPQPTPGWRNTASNSPAQCEGRCPTLSDPRRGRETMSSVRY